MTERQVVKRADTPASTSRRDEVLFVPDADISENAEHIRLICDMPGVDADSVEASVENGVLRLEGRAHVDAPDGYERVGREFRLGRFRREFTLGEAVDAEGIKARVRHGTLEVTIPKREEVKNRRIEIEH